MPLKVNDFVIQAKVKEDGVEGDGECNVNSDQQNDGGILSDSQKKEIIDQCFDRMKEYLERDKNRF